MLIGVRTLTIWRPKRIVRAHHKVMLCKTWSRTHVCIIILCILWRCIFFLLFLTQTQTSLNGTKLLKKTNSNKHFCHLQHLLFDRLPFFVLHFFRSYLSDVYIRASVLLVCKETVSKENRNEWCSSSGIEYMNTVRSCHSPHSHHSVSLSHLVSSSVSTDLHPHSRTTLFRIILFTHTHPYTQFVFSIPLDSPGGVPHWHPKVCSCQCVGDT